MHFVPWKTIDLDGAFRITAPDSISEEVIQEVSNGITFKFNGKLEKTKLEILLTAPFEWEETLHPTERENPPVKFICRLISRSTGRREIIELEDGGWILLFRDFLYTFFKWRRSQGRSPSCENRKICRRKSKERLCHRNGSDNWKKSDSYHSFCYRRS